MRKLTLILVGLVVLASCSSSGAKTVDASETTLTVQSTEPVVATLPVVTTVPVASTVLVATTAMKKVEAFSVTSSAMTDGGAMPAVFTCDGQSVSPPLAWSQGPVGTKSYAILMDHQPGPGDWKWYWQVWGIDASVLSISQGATNVGVMGGNELSTTPSYEPPCSKGPGAKKYTFHVYALSAAPKFSVSPGVVTREMLLAAIEPLKLAEATMTVTNTRS